MEAQRPKSKKSRNKKKKLAGHSTQVDEECSVSEDLENEETPGIQNVSDTEHEQEVLNNYISAGGTPIDTETDPELINEVAEGPVSGSPNVTDPEISQDELNTAFNQITGPDDVTKHDDINIDVDNDIPTQEDFLTAVSTPTHAPEAIVVEHTEEYESPDETIKVDITDENEQDDVHSPPIHSPIPVLEYDLEPESECHLNNLSIGTREQLFMRRSQLNVRGEVSPEGGSPEVSPSANIPDHLYPSLNKIQYFYNIL